MGVTLLRAGVLNTVLVGGYDPEAEYAAAGFASLRLVASERPRPYCRDREGLRLGGGYAALVLERASDASARGVRVLAEVLGCGESADAFHLTRPHPEGQGAARAMKDALERARVTADTIDCICAHATGTQANDAAEFRAMRMVLGDRLVVTPVVAFKSHVGHTLGAAGAVELVLSLMVMREGVVPPTPNVSAAEIEFEGLDLVIGRARHKRIQTTMNLSLGFGGANACVVLGTLRKGEQEPVKEQPDSEVAITGVGMLAPGAVGNDRMMELLGQPRPPRDSVRGGSIAPDDLAPLIADYKLRRQSEYSKLTIAAAGLALAHAGVTDRAWFTAGCGAILGTAHGSVGYSELYYREIVEKGPESGNPMLFAEGVPNAGAAQLSIALGITGGCHTILGSRTAGLEALALASLRIRRGEWRRAIVGGADEFSETVNAGYEACGLTGASGGFVAGSGAGALVLERLDDARARDARVLATVGSFGLAFAQTQAADVIMAAIEETLVAAGADGPVIGSANGTWIDEIERSAVRCHRSHGQYESMDAWLPEMFAAGPLVCLGAAILRGRGDKRRVQGGLERTGLCVDPMGPIAATSVHLA